MISVTEMQETSVLTVKSRVSRAENQRMLKTKIAGMLSSCNCGVVIPYQGFNILFVGSL
ncbi:hypothetical protein C8R30_1251 [Nitrosomonas nitrosa]|nr:hypothetical protein C8R30_1251 [Nitrosomonas nitrosa]